MHLYIMQQHHTNLIKIGRSNNPQKRLKQLQTGSPYVIKMLKIFTGLGNMERELHALLSDYRIRNNGEWFDSECLAELPTWMYECLDLETQ